MSSVPFGQTIRSLNAGRDKRRGAQLIILLLLISGWLTWSVVGEVPVVATSRRARGAAAHSVHHVAAPHAGHVVVSHATLGRTVEQGDVIVILDPRLDTIRRDKLAAEVANLADRIAHLTRELEAIDAQATAEIAQAHAGTRAARASRAEREQLVRILDGQVERLNRLGSEGIVAESEARDAERRLQAGHEHLRQLAAIEEEALRSTERVFAQNAARRRAAQSQHLALASDLSAAKAQLAEIGLRIDQLTIRAPVAGQISGTTDPVPGQYVADGQLICSIAPQDTIDIAAWFAIEDMPIVHPGQAASVWLDTRADRREVYSARVVAVERAGDAEFRALVRVVSDRTGKPASSIGQGFPAVVVVEVERVSPLDALLRTAGLRQVRP